MSSQLINSRLPTDAEYASLQDVHNVQGLFIKNATFVDAARDLFTRHGVTDKFVLFALHKHFDVPAGNVLLQEPVALPNGSFGEVVHPVPASADVVSTGHAVAYFVKDGALQPYKFAAGAGPDLSEHGAFLADFVALTEAHGAAANFAIKLPNIAPTTLMSEGEIPDYGATLLIPGSLMPAGTDSKTDAAVNFSAPADECAANEKHAKKTNGNHQVFQKRGNTAPMYHAALAVITNTLLRCAPADKYDFLLSAVPMLILFASQRRRS